MNNTVSVVCASIGRPSLHDLIDNLARCDVVDEIIIVLPPKECCDSNNFKIAFTLGHVRIFNSHVQGQVQQRVFGVRQATKDYLLFIDDDISITPNTIDTMLNFLLNLPGPAAIAPKIKFSGATNTKHEFRVDFFLIILKYIDRVLTLGVPNAPCSLSYFHHPFAVHSNNSNPSSVDWLPGGCILMPRRYAPMESYYNFSGKAYAEDIYLSHFLQSAGVSLYYDNSVYCNTHHDVISYEFNHRLFARLAIYQLSLANGGVTLFFLLVRISSHLILVFSVLLILRLTRRLRIKAS